MLRIAVSAAVPLVLLLAGCSAQGEKIAQELENMPGLTCTTDRAGQTHCGPDTVEEALAATES